jgi:fermentation-respiration switch protein FrsA (DUF1100 family)
MRAGIILLVVAAVLATPVVLLWAFQRRLLYFPTPGTVPPAASLLPGAQEVDFDTADGLRLAGWFVPAHPRGEPGEGPGGAGPAVLVCNGNGGDRSMRAPLAAALARMGLHVLLFDYRGYGGNPGHPSEDGLAADAGAALDHLAAWPEVDPARVIYFGESLGAAVAVRLATERPPAALVLRSPFASLAEVGRLHYPWLPVSLLLADRYDSLGRVGGLAAPLLVVAGERDRIVPPSHSRRLFDAAPQPKRFVLLPGADHNDLDLLAGPGLLDEVLAFLGQVPTLAAGGR